MLPQRFAILLYCRIQMGRSVVVFLLSSLVICGCSTKERPDSELARSRTDTLSEYPNGTAAAVHHYRADSLVEKRYYRPTGTLQRVERGDSLLGYLDLHDLDSAAVLKDYLQGRWRNLSVDSSTAATSTYYIFDGATLTFENESGAPLESVGVTYKKNRTLTTEEGMSVDATIIAFDTVEVTGYRLVRMNPPAR